MTEEVKVEGVEPVIEPSTPPEPSPVEKRAMEMGWRPKEEFQGDEDDFIDAKEFVRRKPLFEKIDAQSRELKAVRRALEEFKGHYNKVNEAAVTTALQRLKDERKQAMTEGDGERFEQLDEQIKQTEATVTEIRQQAAKPAVQDEVIAPEFQNWKSRNPWYDSVGYMRKFADDYGTKLALQGVAPAEVLKQVDKAVREEFPTKFRNPNKDAAPAVEVGTNGTSNRNNGKLNKRDLNEQERKVMGDLVRSGVLTEEQYLADLAKVKSKGIA